MQDYTVHGFTILTVFLALRSTECVLRWQNEQKQIRGSVKEVMWNDSVKLGWAVKFLSGLSAKAVTQAFEKLDILFVFRKPKFTQSAPSSTLQKV